MIMNEKLQVGDVVCLNSGGPQMKVKAITQDGKILCFWDDEGTEFQQLYNPTSLTPVDR